MALAEVEALVADLVATGKISSVTQEELASYVDLARRDALDPEDLNYVRALHAKLLGGHPADPSAPPPDDDDSSVAYWKARALKAEAELAVVQQANNGATAGLLDGQ